MGRGQTLDTVQRDPYQVPCRKARVGEVAPGFLGISLQHARYFKQLRRLQALSQQQLKGATTLNARINREETWRALRRAPGFPGGFGSGGLPLDFFPVSLLDSHSCVLLQGF